MKRIFIFFFFFMMMSMSTHLWAYDFVGDQSHYIGEWKGDGYKIEITNKGDVHYERVGMLQKSVNGTISHFDGNNIIVKVLFVPTTFEVSKAPYRENGYWKMVIDGVEVKKQAQEDDQALESSDSIPQVDVLKNMVGHFMNKFALSVYQKDFSILYQSLSELWKAQTNANELAKIFKVFTDKEIDLRHLKDSNPIFSIQPKIDKDKILIVEGYYPFKDYKVEFKMEWTYEYPQWMPISIKVHVVPFED